MRRFGRRPCASIGEAPDRSWGVGDVGCIEWDGSVGIARCRCCITDQQATTTPASRRTRNPMGEIHLERPLIIMPYHELNTVYNQ